MSGSGGPLDGYYSQLGQLRSVTDGWRTMPGPVRPLSETTNELTQGAPTWADAWEHNKAAYQDWAEKQRVAGVAAGEIDPETGWPTPAGARSAATSAAMGLVMGSTAPEFKAPRIANPLRAYHGSPHEFAPTERNPLGEFDPAKVGTGEGAQVYGVGAGYLTENEGIAEHYRRSLSGSGVEMVQGDKSLGRIPGTNISNDPQWVEAYRSLMPTADAPDWIKSGILRDIRSHGEATGRNVDLEAARQASVARTTKEMEQFPADQQKRAIDAVHEAYNSIGGDVQFRAPGHMYEAEVHIDPEHMLHWDLPLSQQSKYVQERLGKVGGLEGYRDPTGEKIYGQLSRPRDVTQSDWAAGYHAGDQAAASEALRDAGIPALRYADANSRGRLRTWEAERGQLQDDVAFYESQLGPNATYPSESTAARGVLQRALDQSRKQLADHEANKADIKHNMVVFDPKHIDIVRRYGIGALIGGGAAAGAAQGGE